MAETNGHSFLSALCIVAMFSKLFGLNDPVLCRQPPEFLLDLGEAACGKLMIDPFNRRHAQPGAFDQLPDCARATNINAAFLVTGKFSEIAVTDHPFDEKRQTAEIRAANQECATF